MIHMTRLSVCSRGLQQVSNMFPGARRQIGQAGNVRSALITPPPPSPCSPNSVDRLGVLMVVVKHRCLTVVLANSLLFTVHLCLSKSSKCISTAQNLVGWRRCSSRLCSRCGAVRIFGHGGHFSWQAQGKQFWWSDCVAGTAVCEPPCADFVASAALCEPRSAALCEPRSGDFVAGIALCEAPSADSLARAALCEPRRANFVAGAVLCDPQSADFVAGAALCEAWQAQHFVNLKVQLSWQAHFVNLKVAFVAVQHFMIVEVQTSWQGRHFVNLEVQISRQAQRCEPRNANFRGSAALYDPQSADFVAGTALCEPQSADFVAGTAL